MNSRDQTEEESVNLNFANESITPISNASKQGRFSSSRSKSADTDESGRRTYKPRRLSNQFSIEMAKRCRCGEDTDVVDDAGRQEDTDEIQVHVTSSRSFGLSSSFLRRKKDEYEGDERYRLGLEYSKWQFHK